MSGGTGTGWAQGVTDDHLDSLLSNVGGAEGGHHEDGANSPSAPRIVQRDSGGLLWVIRFLNITNALALLVVCFGMSLARRGHDAICEAPNPLPLSCASATSFHILESCENCMHFDVFSNDLISRICVSAYMLPLGMVLLLFEMGRSPPKEGNHSGCSRRFLEKYCGFIFLYSQRWKYLLLLGFLSLSLALSGAMTISLSFLWGTAVGIPVGVVVGTYTQKWMVGVAVYMGVQLIVGLAITSAATMFWPPFIVGCYSLLNSLIHMFVAHRHPEHDNDILKQLQLSCEIRTNIWKSQMAQQAKANADILNA